MTGRVDMPARVCIHGAPGGHAVEQRFSNGFASFSCMDRRVDNRETMVLQWFCLILLNGAAGWTFPPAARDDQGDGSAFYWAPGGHA